MEPTIVTSFSRLFLDFDSWIFEKSSLSKVRVEYMLELETGGCGKSHCSGICSDNHNLAIYNDSDEAL